MNDRPEDETAGRRAELRRVDPDPVSVLLAALGALGSFASLAAYAEFRRDKRRERRRARRTVLRAISASREALEDVDSALDKLERLLERAKDDLGETSARRLLEAPAAFGAVNAFFDFFEFSAYQMLAQRVTRAFDTLVRETYEIMDAIEDGAVEAPRDLFVELHALQGRLEVLRRSERSFSEVIDATRSVTQSMARIADELERHIALDRTG